MGQCSSASPAGLSCPVGQAGLVYPGMDDKDDKDFRAAIAKAHGLNPGQLDLYMAIYVLVDEALEQFAKGWAVDVEQQIADVVKNNAVGLELSGPTA